MVGITNKERNTREWKLEEIRGILIMLAEDNSQSLIDTKRAMELNQFLKTI